MKLSPRSIAPLERAHRLVVLRADPLRAADPPGSVADLGDLQSRPAQPPVVHLSANTTPPISTESRPARTCAGSSTAISTSPSRACPPRGRRPPPRRRARASAARRRATGTSSTRAQRSATASGSATATRDPLQPPGRPRPRPAGPVRARPSARTPAGPARSSDTIVPPMSAGCRWVPEMSGRSICQTTRTPSLADPPARGRRVVELEDRHVAAVAAAAFELAPGGRARAGGGDDLDEAVAERVDRVAQSELGHAGVGEGLAEAELAPRSRSTTGSSSAATRTAWRRRTPLSWSPTAQPCRLLACARAGAACAASPRSLRRAGAACRSCSAAAASSSLHAVLDPAAQDVDVGRRVVVAGDAEVERAVVGEDRDADRDRPGQRHVGEALEHPPARRRRAGSAARARWW